MRIGIDARVRAYRAGGIAQHVSRLIRGLAELAPPETLVVLDHRRAPAEPDPQDAAGLPRWRLFTPPHHRLEGWALPVELLPARLDLLHSPDVVVPRAWRGASVITVHDVAFLRHPEFLTADSLRYYRGVHRAVKQAARVITVSDYTRRELEALTDVDPERIRVVYNAVEAVETCPAQPGGPTGNRPGDPPGDPASDAAVAARYGLTLPFILFVSTIEPRKNVETLLEAYRALLDAGRDVGLALAGSDGWHSEAIYARAKALGIADRARFLGFVPDADLAALYRAAALLAHPAHDEGFGFTPAEAMAAGTPVLVSDAGSLPEVVGGAGLRLPPTDVAAWAAALGRVLDEPALAAGMAEAGRRQAAQFTLRRQAEGTLAVYREAWAVWSAGQGHATAERARSAMDQPAPGREQP